MLELSTADAQEGKILLNVKKDFTLTVNGRSEQKAYNEDVEVTAEDKTGETFTGWTVKGVEVADKSSKKLNFKMPAGDVTLTANYNTNSYTLTVNGKSEQKAYNEDVEVTAEDKTGETFTGWTVEGVEIADKSSKKLNFKMPAGDVTLTANYNTNSYTLTVNGKSEQKAYNEDVEVTAEDKTGETFTGWTVEGVEVADKTSKTLTFTMPAGDVTLTAQYEAEKYTLTVTDGTPESTTAEAGTEVTLTANAPAEGELFDQWVLSENLTLVSGELTDEIITVRMPEGNATAKATYKDAPKTEYTLTVTDGTPESTTAEAGTDVTLTANTPADGKLFDQWVLSENLTLISGDLTDEAITVCIPEGNATAKATYKDAPKTEYTLTVTDGTPESTTAEAGTEVTLIANTPAEGKLFDKWVLSANLTLVSGELTDETITVRMPEGNATVKATYKDAPKPEPEPTYTLTVIGGTPVSTTAEAGTDVTLTANTPEEGKLFDRWELSENLELVSGNLTDEIITVRMPEGNATAKATYKDAPKPEPKSYTIEVQDGTAFVDGAEAVAALVGTEVTLRAKTAPEGMKFSGWQVETPQKLELKDGTAAETTFIMPNASVKVSALYTASEIPDPVPDASGGGAGIAVAAVGVAAGAVIGIGVWAVNRYILTNLPAGMAVPTTRQQLAVVLWVMTGKPDVTPTVDYQDVEGLDAQKAVNWVVEQQLMQPESAEYFGAQGSVNKWQMFQLMKQVRK